MNTQLENIEKFVEQHPNLYFRFEKDSLAEVSIENGEYNDAYAILKEQYEDLGKIEFEDYFPYIYDEKHDLFEANGVNALKGELIEECWMKHYFYNMIYAVKNLTQCLI